MYESNQVGLVEAYKGFWQNYVNFSGRSTRAEYWWVWIANVVIAGVLILFDLAVHSPWLSIIFALASIIPGWALAVRRLHDTDHRGWWIFISLLPLVGWIWLLVLYCQASTPATNRFGERKLNLTPLSST
jgi:uncharacterized membrane protein YhaH (DUF805 family)